MSINHETVLDAARKLVESESESAGSGNPQSETAIVRGSYGRQHESLQGSGNSIFPVSVTERESGASWFTMKFRRERDAKTYAKKRTHEDRRFKYELEQDNSKVRAALCEIPDFLKRTA